MIVPASSLTHETVPYRAFTTTAGAALALARRLFGLLRAAGLANDGIVYERSKALRTQQGALPSVLPAAHDVGRGLWLPAPLLCVLDW